MRGFRDNLPPISDKFEKIRKIFEKFSRSYCVDLIDLPLVEESQLYFRTSGEESEICNKELFEVRRFKGDFEGWALRPEATASCIRAVKENDYLVERKLARLGYYGPMFRYNRPQKGRYRQFIQAGWEWLGSKEKFEDYEIILAAAQILDELNIQYVLEINSIGNFEDRQTYRNLLKSILKTDQDPFKVLDKMDNFNDIPFMRLNFEDSEILKFILQKLDENLINYKHNPYLVRGLDYYNGIVFEFKVNNQTVLAGGRYDGLMQQLGGVYTPAVGFAMGVDRVVDLLDDVQNFEKIALLSLNEDEYCFNLLEQLRKNNFQCMPYWGYDLKKGLKVISKYFKYVIIVGENEKNNANFIIKDLQTSNQFIKSQIHPNLFQDLVE